MQALNCALAWTVSTHDGGMFSCGGKAPPTEWVCGDITVSLLTLYNYEDN